MAGMGDRLWDIGRSPAQHMTVLVFGLLALLTGIVATSIPAVTEKMGGRKPLIIFHDPPSSRLAKSCPVFVPTYTPIGSAASTAIPSRRTPRYAPGPGKPFVERRHALPLFVVFQTAIWPFGNTRFPAPTNGATNAVCFCLGSAAIGNPKSDGRPFVTSVHAPPSGPR